MESLQEKRQQKVTITSFAPDSIRIFLMIPIMKEWNVIISKMFLPNNIFLVKQPSHEISQTASKTNKHHSARRLATSGDVSKEKYINVSRKLEYL